MEAILTCARLVEKTAEEGTLALSEIPSEKWDEHCSPTLFQDEQTISVVDYFGAARELRASLNVNDNIKLSQKYAAQGCPRP